MVTKNNPSVSATSHPHPTQVLHKSNTSLPPRNANHTVPLANSHPLHSNPYTVTPVTTVRGRCFSGYL